VSTASSDPTFVAIIPRRVLLDTGAVQRVLGLLRDLREREGITIVVVTHDPDRRRHRRPGDPPARRPGHGLLTRDRR